MTARYPAEALRPNSSGAERIKEMLDFLNKWEHQTDNGHFLSDSTAEGLRVTLTSTLEMLEYLRKEFGFIYLLTSRLSQDKVENFFGIVRMSSGCNTHPTPQQFLLTVNCLSSTISLRVLLVEMLMGASSALFLTLQTKRKLPRESV
ncbi:hypothetical protein HPB49_005480 [Dermacentor silvarum]|uniref:Uncharacterized protein n=1 Tax=Dermacentor silvarum TaxID=543639 RepID=A0ACB8DVV9_DERSI|nr:hypothetical protein HPB49_005480 [Dermacentor silvarum]